MTVPPPSSSGSPDRAYRIGDFAKYMGVTPDFLKHYEEHGLLEVSHTPSGYRWFGFDQSSRILEYMRLRNYGVSVKEMAGMLSADPDRSFAMLDEKAEALEAQAERLLSFVEEHRRVKAWYAERRTKPVDWEVRAVQAHVFLPHTHNRDFLKNKHIRPILKAWSAWMPIAKSALRVEIAPKPSSESEGPMPHFWGLIIPEATLERFGLPSGNVCMRMPSGKALVFNFVGTEDAFSMDALAAGDHPVFRKMEALGLEPAGSLHLIVEAKLTHPNGTRKCGAGRIIVPVKD